jgi:lipopolysaccharide/colanic/teichoic acid biosynthesis glycosyltransferase
MGSIIGLSIFLAVLLGGVLRMVLSRQLADEFKAWTPWVVEGFVKHAVSRLPEDQRKRFGEEWRSHVNAVPGEIGKFIVAFGFLMAARKISAMLKTGGERHLIGEGMRRVIEITFSAVLLTLVGPLLLLMSLLTKLFDGGPALTNFECVGLNGQKVSLYMFRTTRAWEPNMALMNRPRPRADITRIGTFLRKTEIYLLPMFINILRGDLSLVGPRPMSPDAVEELSRLLPGFEERCKVKPGIAGLAELHFPHDPSTELAYDLEYIRNRTLKLDLLILFRTMKYVFTELPPE